MDWSVRTCDLVGASILWAVGQIAFSYPTPVDFTGKLLRWNIDADDGPIYYEVTGDDIDLFEYESVTDEAAAIWSDVPTSFFRYENIIRAPDSDQKAQVSVKLESSFSGSSTSSGYARFTEQTGKGAPIHCEIHIATGVTGVPKTILHELGHCFGLGHSLVPEAVMSYRTEDNGFFLDTDDVAAVSRLYPADGDTPKLPPGCAVSGIQKPLTTKILMLLPLLFALTRRRETVSRLLCLKSEKPT